MQKRLRQIPSRLLDEAAVLQGGLRPHRGPLALAGQCRRARRQEDQHLVVWRAFSAPPSAAPLAAVDGRLDGGQPHADDAYLFWALVCALGMLVLGLWCPETKDVPMERTEELFGGPWWKRDLERQGRPRSGAAASRVLVLGEGLDGEG
ncbi:hypothetical protein DL767_011423 [Monosporascus sp. MG133]|nr:hypothetical protein DL767_011423 [Monosporascus sp. MG133]